MRLFLAGLGSGMGGAYLLDDLFGADMRMYLAGTTFVTPGYISEGELCDSTLPEPQGDRSQFSKTGGGTLDPLASRVNMLESFYYVQDWQTRNIHRFKRFLLDSGAFTAMYGAGMEAKSLPGYVGRYIDYINANDVTDFFEMDVDSVVGYDRVLEFRREIETQTGKRCIPVWHIERGKHEFQQMCHDYPYVAIGGIATRDGRKRLGPYLRWFVREAHRLGARVHGLGYLSTVIGEFLDMAIFAVMAFAGVLPWEVIGQMVVTNSCAKIAVEVILYPILTKRVIGWAKTLD